MLSVSATSCRGGQPSQTTKLPILKVTPQLCHSPLLMVIIMSWHQLRTSHQLMIFFSLFVFSILRLCSAHIYDSPNLSSYSFLTPFPSAMLISLHLSTHLHGCIISTIITIYVYRALYAKHHSKSFIYIDSFSQHRNPSVELSMSYEETEAQKKT